MLPEPVSTVWAVCKLASAVPLRLSRVPGWLSETLIAAPLAGEPATVISKVAVYWVAGGGGIGAPVASLSGMLKLSVLFSFGLIVPLLITPPLASRNW
ncbi:hypothetical protein D3C73_1018650 [compost metagenome]